MNTLSVLLKKNTPLILIVVSSFLIKLFFLIITKEMPLTNDPADYYQRAIALVEGRGYLGSSYRPPLHPLFLAIIFYLFNKSIVIARFSQVVLSSVNVLVIYGIGKRIFNKNIGLISALIFSLYPTFIFYSHTLWPENLFNLIFTSSLYLIIRYRDEKLKRDLIFAGILWGLASLAKATTVHFIPFIFLWFIINEKYKKGFFKESVKEILIFSCFTFMVIAPWTYRNYLVHKHFVLISTNMGSMFRTGNNFASLFIPVDDCWSNDFTDGPLFLAMKDEYKIDKRLLRAGLHFVKDNKLLFIKKCLWEAYHLFTLDSFALRHLRGRIYGNLSLSTIRAVTMVVVSSFIIVMLLGSLGFVSSRNDKNKWLFIMFIAYTILIHSVTVSMSRYRLPFMPFFIIYTSFALYNFKTILREVTRSSRLYIFLVCIIFLIISWYMSIPLIADMLATGGQHFHFNYCFK